MKRRFAYNLNDNYEQIRVDEDFFKGYACFLKLQNIENPLIVNNGKETMELYWIDVDDSLNKYKELYSDYI